MSEETQDKNKEAAQARKRQELKMTRALKTDAGRDLVAYLRGRFGFDRAGPQMCPGSPFGEQAIFYVGTRAPIALMVDLVEQYAQKEEIEQEG